MFFNADQTKGAIGKVVSAPPSSHLSTHQFGDHGKKAGAKKPPNGQASPPVGGQQPSPQPPANWKQQPGYKQYQQQRQQQNQQNQYQKYQQWQQAQQQGTP